jgi:hypothetical protein
MILPFDAYNLYTRYQGTGLEKSMIYCTSYSFEDTWSNGEYDVPSFVQACDLLSKYGKVAAICDGSIRTEDEDRYSLLVYSRELLDEIRLGEAFDALKEYKNEEGFLPVLADNRLRWKYKIGDKLYKNTVYLQPEIREKDFEIVGFLSSGNEHIRYGGCGSYPSLSMIIEGYSEQEQYLFITKECDDIVPSMYAQATMIVIPNNDSRSDDSWRDTWKKSGRGTIMSFGEMMWRDTMVSFTGDDNVLLLTCVWCFIMLFLGLRGYEANIIHSLTEQMMVYKLHGMSLKSWLLINVLALGLPFLISMILGAYIGVTAMGRSCNFLVLLELAALNIALLLILVVPLILTISRMWNQQSVIASYYEREMI